MDIRLIIEIVTLGGIIIYGVFALIGFFDKSSKQKREEADRADDRVISLLKEQVEALERKVEAQDVELKATTLKLESFMAENKALRDVLQGRDKSTVEYQIEGKKAMLEISETLTISRESAKILNQIAKIMSEQIKK